jgi:membrane protein YdbS with pleckstrin-like domain
MGLPAKLLNPGEVVEADLRPHWKFLTGPSAAVVLATSGSLFALAEGVPRWARLALAGAVVAALLWLVGRWVRWRSTTFVVTNQRLVMRKGVLTRTSREVPLDRLTDTTCHQGLLDRLAGCGDVLVESPGRDSPEVFEDLPRPQEVQGLISRLLSERAGAQVAVPVGREPAGGQPTIADQLAQLADLRRRGVISRREFAAKKAELLSRM